jgi:peptide/nickel transport system substrate-binding protein/oligopeptide transport system substrate-binding protein
MKGGPAPPFMLVLGLGTVLCALALAPLILNRPISVGSATPSSAPDRDGSAVYRRPLGQDPETLDPARLADTYGRSVSQQIFDGLVQFDQTLAIKPALAEFWRASRDGLTWTFELRKGVKFHHGREVVAEDVVYSFSRLLDPKTKSGAAEYFLNIKGARDYAQGRARTVSGLVALDKHTVQVTLNQAAVPFVAVIPVGQAKIVPRDLVEAQGPAFGAQPIGTGPFRFVRWERGKEIVLSANSDHFDGPPKISRLVYRVFPGDQRDAMYDEFLKGHLEDAPVPPRADRRALASGGNHIYVKRPMISLRFYGFNTRVKPLDDRRVRQAIVYAIDRESIIQNVFFGQYTFARGILPPGMLGYNPNVAGYPVDRQKARDLLAEAGYPGGRGLPTITIWSGTKRDDILREHDQIKKALAAVGIAAEFQYLTNWPAFSKMVDDGKAPVFLYAWYADVPDPDNFLAKLFHSRATRNMFGYANPVVDDMLTSARAATDLARRVEGYRKAEQLILDDAPIVPVFHHTYERLFQPYVKSVEVNGLGDPYIPFRKIWLERTR